MEKNINLFAPDKVFMNGNLITMDPANEAAEALAVKNDVIMKVGKNEHIQALIGPSTEVVDLQGKTLMPGFVESHTHLVLFGSTLSQVNCTTPLNESIFDIMERVQKEAMTKPEGEWIRGWGYDDTALKDQRHPTRRELDQVSPNHPVYITHISGHLAVANSYALKIGGINAKTPEPAGGIIYREDNSQEPSGVLAEPPAMEKVSHCIPKPTLAFLKEAIEKGNQKYLSAGVTSIHEAGVGLFFGQDEFTAYLEASAEGKLDIRACLMLYYTFFEELIKERGENLGISTGSAFGKIKIGPVKTLQDGSIQGVTAALQEPYHCKPDYCGVLILEQERLEQIVQEAYRRGFQVSVHGNGDACIESILTAYKKVLGDSVDSDHRFRIEHCQTVTDDQLDRIRNMNVAVSFFPVHTYYWGERHKNIFLGPKRAERIDPLKSALDRGIIFGLHNDCPITEISPLMSIYAAVNRRTMNGEVLGEQERITVEQALKAMTIDSAYLAFEENIKGSLTAGKLADLIVLDENPLKVKSETLKDLQVEMTIVGGDVVYKKNSDSL